MPIKQNAKKAMRHAATRAAENLRVREAMKAAVKAVRKASLAGNDTKELLRAAQQKLDKAAKRGVIKKNTAARRFSRLVKVAAAKAK